jgi:hypothetical protein
MPVTSVTAADFTANAEPGPRIDPIIVGHRCQIPPPMAHDNDPRPECLTPGLRQSGHTAAFSSPAAGHDHGNPQPRPAGIPDPHIPHRRTRQLRPGKPGMPRFARQGSWFPVLQHRKHGTNKNFTRKSDQISRHYSHCGQPAERSLAYSKRYGPRQVVASAWTDSFQARTPGRPPRYQLPAAVIEIMPTSPALISCWPDKSWLGITSTSV